ncbi:putative F-box protein At2g33200 isoform X2 [Tripterygium wilfordii]|uniref:putative F-box protein At2g33200 isoform X2 n=1 Tax=Tripterygium wilfordii TaxID=458696 RepID=UPI0018F85EFD|nr:putative F-box protein At2g33200 isoform X2 [Tripterygium wilfordii]
MLDLPMSPKRRKVVVKESRDWSDLHGDILRLIKEKLCLIDQLRFRAVCRSWRSVPYVKSADKLPWILGLRKAFGCKFLAYYLYDPFNRIEYVLGHQLARSHNVEVYASKHGWLFLGDHESKLFLYHAFTKKTIHLPTLKLASTFFRSTGTFSTIPTSSDCVFYVLDSGWNQTDSIMLYTYRNGDLTWMMWAFDIACGDWRQIPIDASEIKYLDSDFQAKGMSPYRSFKVVESCGELLLVYYRFAFKPWYVFKLDWSLMAWVKQVELGNHALFIGETSFSIPTDGEIKSLAGHIYFHGDVRPHFYSFKNSARHKNSEFRPLRCKYYSHLKRLPRQFEWVWIEPHS